MRSRLASGNLFLPAVLLFVVLAAAYGLSVGLRASRGASITGDEPFYLLTTQSLLTDRDLDLRNQYEFETYRSFFDHQDRLWRQAGPLPDGRLLSPHDPGLSVLLLPGFAIGGLTGAQVELLLLTALTFALAFVLAALETGRTRIAWVASAVTGLTAPAFVYATEIYPEMPAALCLVGALLVLRSQPGVARAVLLALVLSALAWLGTKYVVIGCVVAAFHLWGAGGRERVALLGLAGMSAAAYIGWHLAEFGALTPYNGNLVYDGASTVSVLESHVTFGDRVYRLWGLFVDRRFGIGHWAPLLLAIVPALPLAWRALPSGRPVVALIGVQLLVATFAAVTMMGWWFPGRMLIAVFPLFAVVLTVSAAHAPRPVQVAGGVLAAWSLVITGALIVAARSGEVTLAVDPFAMHAAPFRLLSPFFPDYSWWSIETNVLNMFWLALLAAATIATAAWPYRSRLTRFATGVRLRSVRMARLAHPLSWR